MSDKLGSGDRRPTPAVAASAREGRCGFTLLELLIVMGVILILASIMVLTWPAVRERVLRMHCQTNLSKAQKILMEYGANNAGYLPPMCSTSGLSYHHPGNRANRNYLVEELIEYGASPSIFMCPATEAYENPDHYLWQRWDKVFKKEEYEGHWNPRAEISKYPPSTSGYVFFSGYWPFPPFNVRLYAQFFSLGGPNLPVRVDSPGNPPLGADVMVWDQNNSKWRGFFHDRDRDEDNLIPGGGGHTLWLNGAINWIEWKELEAAMHENPPTSPIWWGTPGWGSYYHAGWKPREEE